MGLFEPYNTYLLLYQVMDACGKFGEHERSVRVALGD